MKNATPNTGQIPTLRRIEGLRTIFGDPVPRPSKKNQLPAVPPVRRPTPQRREADIGRVARAAVMIDPLPAIGQEIIGSLSGEVAIFDLVAAVSDLAGPAVITTLAVASLGFSRPNINVIAAMLDAGRLLSAELVLSDYFKSADAELFGDIAAMLRDRGQQLHVARCHAKIALLAVADGRQFTIEGSANFRSCRNIEQFILSPCPVLFAARRRLIDAAITTAEAA